MVDVVREVYVTESDNRFPAYRVILHSTAGSISGAGLTAYPPERLRANSGQVRGQSGLTRHYARVTPLEFDSARLYNPTCPPSS